MNPLAHSDGATLFRVRDPDQGSETLACCRNGELLAVPATIPEVHERLQAGAALPTGRTLGGPHAKLETLAPATPSKIVCVGLNYRRHAEEMNKSVPDTPLLFLKPPSAVVGPGEPIELPDASEQIDHEGELAVVIGRRIRNADEQAAAEAILGYTCGCDVTARDIQRAEQRYTRAKGFDTFAPLGPGIAPATQFTPADHQLTCRVDGQIRQQSPLDDFIFSVQRVVSFISTVMTLLPGDVIFTGTPQGVGPIEDGETVRVEIDGIGPLVNPVIRR